MKKSIFQKAVSFVMACAVAASAAITTAFAAPDYSITINGSDSIKFGDNNKYTAYQLFSGTVEEDGSDLVLKNLGWGSGFGDVTVDVKDENGEDALPDGNGIPDVVDPFLKELKNSTDTVFGYDVNESKNVFADVKTAQQLADILKDKDEETDIEFLNAFALIVAKYMKEGSGTSGTVDKANNSYKIDLTGKPGYYIVKDDSSEAAGQTYAKQLPILQVVGPASLTIKSDVPTLDKEITTVDGETDNVSSDKNSAVAGVGSKVGFKLTGTLPENYDDYETYHYQFNDTLPKGLTFKGDLTLTVKTGTGTGTITVPEYDENANPPQTEYYKVTPLTDGTGKTTLEVVIKDLKTVTVTPATEIAYGTEIILEYITVVNKDAVDENVLENEAYLTFSNDPSNSSGGTTGTTPTDDTPKDKATVVVFDINMDKNDGDGENNKKLGGVGFTVTDGNNNTAIFHKNSDGTYTFVAWVVYDNYKTEVGDGNDKKEVFDAATWAAVTENAQLLKDIFGESSVTADTLVTEVFTGNTDPELGQLHLKGLAPGTYTFSESSPIKGYEAVENFTVTLVAEVDWTVDYVDKATEEISGRFTGKGTVSSYNYVVGEDYDTDNKVTAVSYQYTGKLYYNVADEKIVAGGTYVNGDANVTLVDKVKAETVDNAADLIVIDNPKSALPKTGGAGVLFYYIGGGLLVMAGVGIMLFSKKKTAKKS